MHESRLRDQRFGGLLYATGLILGAVWLQGCGGSTGSVPATGTAAPASPTVMVSPAMANLTIAQSDAVTVTVSGAAGMPAGSVVLSSGAFASFATTLNAGAATITVPANLLPVGNDTLMASYAPSSASATTYTSATATAMVSVTASGAAAPKVTTNSSTYATAGNPYQALPGSSGTVLVSVTGTQTGVQVFTTASGGFTSKCVQSLPASVAGENLSAANLTLLPNGVDVAVGIGGPGAIFFNAAALATCTSTGYLVGQGTIASDQGTEEIEVTPDGKYAFVSNEYGVAAGAATEGNIGVVSLAYDSSGNVTTGTTLLGQISTGGQAIAGMTLSPDGTRLYVTSEIAGAASNAAGASNPILARTGCVQQAGGASNVNGTLTVIDVAKAEAAPGPSAILATVDAGCSPVRMAESADESTLWVAVRGDNRVLAFSTGMLELNAGNALFGYADTGGTAPVGIRLFHGGQLLAVANSNRFGTGTANAAILNVAVPATASVVQTVATGLFPREFRVGPDDATLYLTNYNSDTLQVIATTVQ